MPRKTKEMLAAEKAEKAAAAALAALAARPFADGSTDPYAARSADDRAAVAASIAADKRGGLSGNELRAKYGERLTGPARRKVLREHGESAGTIARSYDAYRDGETRSGTRHAREHGAAAAAARSEAREVAAREAAAGLSLAACRKAIREAGGTPPRVLGGDDAPLREAAAAVLAAA